MRELFCIDKKDYDPNGKAFERPSARGIIMQGDKLVMIYSRAYGFYKLPGGGIEVGEDKQQALVREVKEETGLTVIPESIKEFGYVRRIQKGKYEPVFIQDNFYYLCQTTDEMGTQELTDVEKEADFVLQYVTPQQALDKNREYLEQHESDLMIQREARVLEFVIDEIKGLT